MARIYHEVIREPKHDLPAPTRQVQPGLNSWLDAQDERDGGAARGDFLERDEPSIAARRGLAPVAGSKTGDLGEENDGAVRAAGRLTRGDFDKAGSEAGEQLIRQRMERLLFQPA